MPQFPSAPLEEESRPEAALVDRAKTGDSVALKVLLAETYGRLRGLISQKVPPELGPLIDPDDVIQDAHVEVFQRIGTFQPTGEDSFFRWTATIAVNRVRSLLRHHRAAKRGGADGRLRGQTWSVEDSSVALLETVYSTSKTPSRSAARREAVGRVQAALAELPQRHREAIRLVYLEGSSVRDTARQLGCTERAVHGLCRRGLRLLAGQLEDPESGR